MEAAAFRLPGEQEFQQGQNMLFLKARPVHMEHFLKVLAEVPTVVAVIDMFPDLIRIRYMKIRSM
jgi:hypothetical protein